MTSSTDAGNKKQICCTAHFASPRSHGSIANSTHEQPTSSKFKKKKHQYTNSHLKCQDFRMGFSMGFSTPFAGDLWGPVVPVPVVASLATPWRTSAPGCRRRAAPPGPRPPSSAQTATKRTVVVFGGLSRVSSRVYQWFMIHIYIYMYTYMVYTYTCNMYMYIHIIFGMCFLSVLQ